LASYRADAAPVNWSAVNSRCRAGALSRGRYVGATEVRARRSPDAAWRDAVSGRCTRTATPGSARPRGY